jgi:hypothetical protein
LAVEQALGTLISSETEVNNGRIVRDEIVSYASGYVDRFDIVSTQPVDNMLRNVLSTFTRSINKISHAKEIV